ncbi:hypothetical protein SEPCBS119000_005294 [Sporothrix epigloea]|uniref:Uncharacterized protein n=1 Tax=Sporothrix epigloea TaxID=1892477 RepID=A0ABP0DXY9_9PEZI
MFMSNNYAALQADIAERRQEIQRQKSTISRAQVIANNAAAYQEKVKAWYAFCEKEYAVVPPERRSLVTEERLHYWFFCYPMVLKSEDESTRPRWTPGCPSHTVLRTYVDAAVKLWKEQKKSGINDHPHPAPVDGAVRKLMYIRKRQEVQWKQDNPVARRLGRHLEPKLLPNPLQHNAQNEQESSNSLATEAPKEASPEPDVSLPDPATAMNCRLEEMNHQFEAMTRQLEAMTRQQEAANSRLLQMLELQKAQSEAALAGFADELNRQKALFLAGTSVEVGQFSLPLNG